MSASRLSAERIAGVARRIEEGGVFGLESLVPDGTEIQSVMVGSYRDKLACLDQLEGFAESRKIRGKYRESILQCADEMLMNALYVAPREAASILKISATKASIAEHARRGVEVRWTYAHRTLFLAVRDTYGSLTREGLLRGWRQAIEASSAAAVGRGLGLFIMTNGSSSVSFSHVPGVATECICSFDTTASKLQLEEVALYEETDDKRIAEIEAASAAARMSSEVTGADRESSPPWAILGLIAIVVILAVAVLLTR
jgi:hypothetical protein